MKDINPPHAGRRYRLLIVALLLVFSVGVRAQSVSVTLTRGNQSALLQSQPSVTFSGSSSPNATITIDEQSTFQTTDGFGFALTQGSAQVISGLNASLQNSLLDELFNPTSGNAISVIRISIAASDLSNSVYYYNNTPGDVNMNNFSLDGPDRQYLIPIIKKIQAINPEIKILATPWSAPPWMKTNNSSIGGRLQPQYYAAYARYFVRYLEEMAQEGITIWGITPQNEPENPYNEPSMLMNASEQVDFINNHLGPAISTSPFSPKIIAFDHNCDNTSYPITVLNNSSYAEGAAFHLYAGDISAMSTVHDQTGKNVYFTEQFTSSNGSFDGDFGWHMENVVIGSLRNWSKTVIEWNLAADPNSNPRTPGGCSECLGAITVNDAGSIRRNVSYYIISQLSKFADPGAVRLASNDDGIRNVAMRNPDGSKALLVYNRNSADQSISVNWNGKSFSYSIPARSAVTFTWDDNVNPPSTPQLPYGGVARDLASRIEAEDYDTGGASLAYNDVTSGNAGGAYRNDDVDIQATSDAGGGYNVGWIRNDEWLEYTVEAASGTFDVTLRASSVSGGAVTVKLGSTVLGTVSIPATGGWQTFQTFPLNNVSVAEGGNRILRLEFSGSLNLNWIAFSPVSPPPASLSGTYTVESVLSGKVLDVEGVSTASGANVQQWTNFSADNQQWVVAEQSDGSFTLTARHSGLRLAVAGSSEADGANVIQASPANTAYQRWKIEAVGNGNYRIINQGSNKALDVQDQSSADGANVQQWTTFGGPNQQWKLIAIARPNARTASARPIIQTPSEREMLRIYPNPVTDHTLLVEFGKHSDKARLTVSDLSGRILFAEFLSGQHSTVYLPRSLAQGVYLVSVTDGPQQRVVRMIIR